MAKRKTVGELSGSLMNKEPDSRDPIELQREMQKEYRDSLIECCRKGINGHTGDFFVVVVSKKERLMPNVFRNYFLSRISCPTPDYDQAVYRYRHKHEELEYLWCIPDKETCLTFLDNKKKIVSSEQGLLHHIIDFENGDLYLLAKKLNNESYGSIVLES